MKKADCTILAAAIKKHGIERTEGHGYHYATKEHAEGARRAMSELNGKP